MQKKADEQITVQDLVGKMEEHLQDSGGVAYSQTYMKTCLQKHFGDELITFADGKPNVVTFRKTAAAILNEFHEMEKNAVDVEAEKPNIIRTAAELIKSDTNKSKQLLRHILKLKLRLNSTLIFFPFRFRHFCRVFWPLMIK